MFLYCVRINGKKWQAVAGTNSGGCMAGAGDVFGLHGFTGGEVQWKVVAKQKNFAGFSPAFRMVEATDEETKNYWFKSRFEDRCGMKSIFGERASVDSFIEDFPDAERIRAELQAIADAVVLPAAALA